MTKIRHQSESLFIILHSRYTVNVLTGRGGKEHAPAIFITRHACRRIHGSHRHLHRGTKRSDDDRLCHFDDCCDGCWVRLKGTFTKTSMTEKVPFVQDERNLFFNPLVFVRMSKHLQRTSGSLLAHSFVREMTSIHL